MEKILWSRAAHGRERNFAGEKKSAGGGAFGDLGLGAGAAEIAGQRRQLPARYPGRGLYAPSAGSPDALKVAPDSCAERYAKLHHTRRWPPDAGFSVRCPMARQVSTGRTSPDAAGTLFLRPVSAVWHSQRTGRIKTASGAPLSTFST